MSSPAFETSDSQTRPANTTAYAAQDVVGEATAANLEFTGVGGISGGMVLLTAVSLRIDSDAAVVAGAMRLHLFNEAPTPIADNSAFNILAKDRAAYLGYIDIPAPTRFDDTQYAQDDTIRKGPIQLAKGSMTLYGVLETVGAFTPASAVVKTVKLGGTQY